MITEIISFILGILSKIIYDLYNKYTNSKTEEKDYDMKIFLKIKNELLPFDGGIKFIKDNNFASSFLSENIKDFFKIYDYHIGNPEFNFIDKKLEKLKNNLFTEIKLFVDEISGNTFPGRNGSQSIPSEWEIEKPKKFFDTVEKIHELTGKILINYNLLIDYGRKKFKT